MVPMRGAERDQQVTDVSETGSNPYAGCYIEKVTGKWQISNPDCSCLCGGFSTKGAASRYLDEIGEGFRL